MGWTPEQNFETSAPRREITLRICHSRLLALGLPWLRFRGWKRSRAGLLLQCPNSPPLSNGFRMMQCRTRSPYHATTAVVAIPSFLAKCWKPGFVASTSSLELGVWGLVLVIEIGPSEGWPLAHLTCILARSLRFGCSIEAEDCSTQDSVSYYWCYCD